MSKHIEVLIHGIMDLGGITFLQIIKVLKSIYS